MCDFYPQETLSFNSLSDDCPVKLLDYGLMTEKIQDKVILSRRKSRDMKKDVLVKKLELRQLKACLYELDRLGRLDPSNSIIDLHKKKYLVGSKKKIVKFFFFLIRIIFIPEFIRIKTINLKCKVSII